MAQVKALILTGYGINCDNEAEFAMHLAGADARRVHINDLIAGLDSLDNYRILVLPGGFSYGDDIAAGKVLANKIVSAYYDEIKKFASLDRLIIGICNGFQVMIKCGLFNTDGRLMDHQESTLSMNDSGRFEDRWAYLKRASDKCVFTRGIERVFFPVAHGEGKLIAPDDVIKKLEAQDQVVFRYTREDGSPANGEFPANPNGSSADMAGICDPSGRIFGLMPHPERYLHATNNPYWTRLREEAARRGEKFDEEGQGLKIFKNAVEYFK